MKRKPLITLLLAVAVAAAAQTPAPPSSVPERLSWPEVAARTGNHETVRQAVIAKSMAGSLLASAESRRGPRIGLSPSVQFGDPDDRMEVVQTGISGDLQIPLGTTEEDRERRIAAGEKFILSDRELQAAYGRAYTELFTAYAASYLAQKSAGTWEKEVEYARLKAESVRQKVARGLLPVSEQTDAESEFQAAAEKLLGARLEQRLAWFNLAYHAGLETPRTGQGLGARQGTGEAYGMIPVFDAPGAESLVRDPPQPSRLMTEARSSLPELTSQRQKVETARRGLSYQSAVEFDFVPRITYATQDASASLGFSTGTGTISTSTFLPFYTLDWKTKSGTDVLDNSLTLALGVNMAISAAGADDRAALSAAIDLEERRLFALEQMSDLQVRSRYAAFVKARDSLAEAERAVIAAAEASAVVRTRGSLGLVSPEDEAADRVLSARAAYNREKAGLDLAAAYLNLIGSANAWGLAGVSFAAPAK